MIMKKKLMAIAAVSALGVATAVPAMALENEFHGLFRTRAFISNFDDGSAGALAPSYQPGTKNYLEQRARLMYIAKANDDLKLVTHFEFDSRWGDNSYNSNSTTRNNGGAIGADQTNLETKNIYLDFNCPITGINYKLGVQGFTDAYKGIIFNNDAAGLVASKKYGNAEAKFGYFRFDDATTGNAYIANGSGSATTAASGAGSVVNSTVGNQTRDFLTLGGKYSITKDLKVGADYYLLYSDVLRTSQNRTDIHMIGVNAEAKVGPATVDGFLVYQTGKMKKQVINAFAANVGGKVKAGPGTARVNALYISGDNNPGVGDRNDFQTIMERGATTSGHTFYAGEMLLLLRSKYATAGTDRAVVFDLNNSSQGLIGGFLGYDVTIGKAFINSNVGLAAIAKSNSSSPAGNVDSNYIGTEINTEIGYKLYDNLTASFQAAYLIAGDLYKNKTAGGHDPENPYSTRIMVTYTF